MTRSVHPTHKVRIFNVIRLFQFVVPTHNTSSMATETGNKWASPSKIVMPSVMLGFGIIGGVIILKVLVSKKFWSSTSAILLGIVAVLDICHLLADFVIGVTAIKQGHLRDTMRYFADVSHWTVVLVTVERLLVAMFPLDIRLLSMCRRRRFIIAFVGIVLSLAALHGSTYALRNFGMAKKILKCTTYGGMHVLPFLAIAVLDCLILATNLRHKWKSGRNRVAATPFRQSVSAMVVGANVLLLLTYLPAAVFHLPKKCLGRRFWDPATSIFKESVNIASSLGEASKVLVYMALCASFRAGVMDVFSCK